MSHCLVLSGLNVPFLRRILLFFFAIISSISLMTSIAEWLTPLAYPKIQRSRVRSKIIFIFAANSGVGDTWENRNFSHIYCPDLNRQILSNLRFPNSFRYPLLSVSQLGLIGGAIVPRAPDSQDYLLYSHIFVYCIFQCLVLSRLVALITGGFLVLILPLMGPIQDRCSHSS